MSDPVADAIAAFATNLGQLVDTNADSAAWGSGGIHFLVGLCNLDRMEPECHLIAEAAIVLGKLASASDENADAIREAGGVHALARLESLADGVFSGYESLAAAAAAAALSSLNGDYKNR